jgi:acetyl esterase/lipase
MREDDEMDITRRVLAHGAAASALIAGGAAFAETPAGLDAAMAPEDGAPHAIIPLWPRRPPGAPHTLPAEQVIERSTPPALRDRAVLHVARPMLIVFRAAQPNGAAILMSPGGSYQRVVLDKEGYESAARFNAAGVTVFILVYRLPEDGWTVRPDAALQDAQRAMRLIRARAGEFGVDATRIASLGFSAGGHVAGSLALRYDAAAYARVDAADDLSARPDLSLLLYPVVTMEAPYAHAGSRDALLGAGASAELMRANSLEHLARADGPPTFLAVAADDDTIPVENSITLYEAIRAAGVPAELHVFESGGHGFGIRFTVGKPIAAWPDLALAWMRAHGALG